MKIEFRRGGAVCFTDRRILSERSEPDSRIRIENEIQAVREEGVIQNTLNENGGFSVRVRSPSGIFSFIAEEEYDAQSSVLRLRTDDEGRRYRWKIKEDQLWHLLPLQ